jgi:hypothetical protein
VVSPVVNWQAAYLSHAATNNQAEKKPPNAKSRVKFPKSGI